MRAISAQTQVLKPSPNRFPDTYPTLFLLLLSQSAAASFLLLTAAALRPSPSPPADAAVTLFITVVSAPAPSSFRTMDGWPKAAANMSGVIAPLSGVSLSCKVAQHALSTGRWRELSTGPGARLAR